MHCSVQVRHSSGPKRSQNPFPPRRAATSTPVERTRAWIYGFRASSADQIASSVSGLKPASLPQSQYPQHVSLGLEDLLLICYNSTLPFACAEGSCCEDAETAEPSVAVHVRKRQNPKLTTPTPQPPNSCMTRLYQPLHMLPAKRTRRPHLPCWSLAPSAVQAVIFISN